MFPKELGGIFSLCRHFCGSHRFEKAHFRNFVFKNYKDKYLNFPPKFQHSPVSVQGNAHECPQILYVFSLSWFLIVGIQFMGAETSSASMAVYWLCEIRQLLQERGKFGERLKMGHKGGILSELWHFNSKNVNFRAEGFIFFFFSFWWVYFGSKCEEVDWIWGTTN